MKHDYNFLMRVGSKIGKPIRVDNATSTLSRGHYARICVKVDLLKPLVSNFRFRRRIRKLEYEGIHLVCFRCGMYGHRKKIFPSKILMITVPTLQEPSIRDDKGKESNRKITGETEGGDIEINQEIVEDFGPWMLAKRRIRRVPITQRNQETLDSLRKGKAKKRAQMNCNHRDFMEGVR